MALHTLSGHLGVLSLALFLVGPLCLAVNAPGTLGTRNIAHCDNGCVHGTCVGHRDNHNNFYTICHCDHGWHGDQCTHQTGGTGYVDHCHSHCVHGTCVGHRSSQGHHHNCECDEGWHGDNCNYQRHHEGGLASSSVKPPQSLTTTTTTPKPTTTTTTTTTTTPKPTTTTTTTTTPKPTTMTTTLPAASATSSQRLATSVKAPSALPTCDHSAILIAVAQLTQVVNRNGAECSPGSHTSHDALVLTHCSVPQNPSSWQQGVNVMSYCSGSSSLHTYTPIAAFDNGVYSSTGSLSGVFLGCTNTGFKIALQTCGQPPHITEVVTGGTNTLNPFTYYTIF